jgi:hypothetical protein
MNVAVSRAQESFLFFGDPDLLTETKFETLNLLSQFLNPYDPSLNLTEPWENVFLKLDSAKHDKSKLSFEH